MSPLKIKPERADKWRGRTLTTESPPRNCSEDGNFDPKKVKKEPSVNTVDEFCTSDVEVVSEGPQICHAVASVPGDGKEVEFVGATGKNALTDFPHARACYLIHPSQADPVKHCENCFCYATSPSRTVPNSRNTVMRRTKLPNGEKFDIKKPIPPQQQQQPVQILLINNILDRL